MKYLLPLLIALSANLSSQEMHTVFAGNYYYSPTNLQINQGDTVEFINEGGYHDVAITSGPEMLSLSACSGPCDIGYLIFNVPGNYEYICSIGSHADLGMVGTIAVNEISSSAQVQIVHNSPSPTVDIYVDDELALADFGYRTSTGMLELPINTEIGIAPAGDNVIAVFPFELSQNGTYVVVASGILGDDNYPFDLLSSTLAESAADAESFALKVMHGVTDAPAVDIYADGELLIENLAFGDFQGYIQVPVGDYTLDITQSGSTVSLASFSAPLASYGGLSGIVYASGFLQPEDGEPAFSLVLTTPSGYSVELPADNSALTPPQVQIIHNSPYPTVDIYLDNNVALEDVTYRTSTGLLEIPLSTIVGIAPANEEIIASFPFQLTAMQKYVVIASGIAGDTEHPLDLLASSLQGEAIDENHFALKVMHGVTDAPAVDIYANGGLLIENLGYGNFQGYYNIPVGDYTLDITSHSDTNVVASFGAPLSSYGGMSGIIYASGFLSPAETDSAFSLMLTTPSGNSVKLPVVESVLALENITSTLPNDFVLFQNFPNPFNPTTTITYQLQTSSAVEISVYDILGNLVRKLYKGVEAPGTKHINWNATDDAGVLLSSGIYFYKVQVGNTSEIKRMMYLK